MYPNPKNLTRHLVLLFLSFLILAPCIWLLTESYYTSISKVNYWEEQEIVALLTVILKTENVEHVQKELVESLNSIRYLAIKIDHVSALVVDKPIEGAEIDPKTKSTYKVNDYTVTIHHRIYPNYIKSYSRYLSCFTKFSPSIYLDRTKRLNHSSSLLYHHNLIILIAHLAILFTLEVTMITFSVRFRLNQLRRELAIA